MMGSWRLGLGGSSGGLGGSWGVGSPISVVSFFLGGGAEGGWGFGGLGGGGRGSWGEVLDSGSWGIFRGGGA